MAKNIQERINLKFNIPMLDRVIIAIKTTMSNRKFIKNVNDLFNNITEEYKIDYEKEFRIYLIKNMTALILKRNISTQEALLSELNIDGKYEASCSSLLSNYTDAYLSPEDLAAVDEMVSDQLRYGVIQSKLTELSDTMTVIEAENYESFQDEMDKVESLIQDINCRFNNVKESIAQSKYDVDLSDEILLDKLQEIIDDENNPSHKIKTGIQMFNTMLDGGFESERLYCLGGVAKGFKSGLMLNIAMWAKMYNSFKTKDPNKKPVILYITLENTIKDSLKRTCKFAFGNGFKANSYGSKDLKEMLDQSNISSESGAHIKMLFRPNKSISTEDIYTIMEDMEKENEECVFLIVDYLNRLKPIGRGKSSEMRFELSDISNDLSTLAKVKAIPVLTATQMNREAFRMIEQADSFDEKLYASTKIGASQVGEAIAIVQNVDMFIVLNRLENTSKDEEGNVEFSDKYLMLHCIASRGNTPAIEQFNVRFRSGNDLRLVEDINLDKPLTTITTEEHVGERAKRTATMFQGIRRVK